jgi:hypothetical protein
MRRLLSAIAVAAVLGGANTEAAGQWRRVQPTGGCPTVTPSGTFEPLTGRFLGVVPPAPPGRFLPAPGPAPKTTDPLVMPAPKLVPDKKK